MRFIETIKSNWYALPAWARKVIMEAIENASVALSVYLYAVIDGNVKLSATLAFGVLAKGFLKGLRAHPDVPVPDYVNDQAEKTLG